MSWIYRILVNILFIIICIKDAVCNICKININLQSWDYNLTWTVKTFALVHYHFNLKFQKFEMSSSILHLIETGDTVTPFQWQWIPVDGTFTYQHKNRNKCTGICHDICFEKKHAAAERLKILVVRRMLNFAIIGTVTFNSTFYIHLWGLTKQCFLFNNSFFHRTCVLCL